MPQLDEIAEGLMAATRLYYAGKVGEAIETLLKFEQAARATQNKALLYIVVQKAGWLREIGRIDGARAALKEAEDALAGDASGENPLLPGLRLEQGIVAMKSGELDRAAALLLEAKQLAAQSPAGIVMMSDILANLAAVYMDQGKLTESQAILWEAIGYDAKTRDPRALSSNLNMLGQVYTAMRDFRSARLYLTQSRDVAQQARLPKELADAIGNLAIVSELEGADDAEAGFLQALAMAEEENRLPEIASGKCSLGIMASRKGDYEKAYQLFQEAYRIHSQLGLAEFSANGLLNLAQTALSLERTQEAVDHATAALRLIENVKLTQLLWIAHLILARSKGAAFLERSSDEEDLATLASEIMDHYVRAADAVELMRAGIGRPGERQLLMVDKEAVFSEGMFFAGVVRNANLAWMFAERGRGRAFLDMLGPGRLDRQAEKHPLAARRAALANQLLELEDRQTPEAKALSDEIQLLRTRIFSDAPTVAAITESDLPNIGQATAAIPPDTAIVEFFLGPGKQLMIFVLKQSGLATMVGVSLGEIDLFEKVQEFRTEILSGKSDEPSGVHLFQLLFMPVWKHIEPVGRLMVVPHGVLHYLPFSALWFGNSGEGPSKLYLCQRFQLSILPSVAFFQYTLKLPRPTQFEGSALVLGNPTLDLPGSASEAAGIAKYLGVTPLLGAEATRESILKSDHALIHIASHGAYDENDPLLSGVELSDGRLTVEDLLEARMSAGLLVLSGCVTGISRQHAGDELIGLSRAALSAGVPSVIATLWEVGDQASAIFFERFYGNLRKGMGKDAALGVTQMSMIADERWKNSRNWAPYVLLGDCR